jgi:hypothetical protein
VFSSYFSGYAVFRSHFLPISGRIQRRCQSVGKLLEGSGTRLRETNGELEVAGPIDDLGAARLRIYKDAFIERLQAREMGRRV